MIVRLNEEGKRFSVVATILWLSVVSESVDETKIGEIVCLFWKQPIRVTSSEERSVRLNWPRLGNTFLSILEAHFQVSTIRQREALLKPRLSRTG